MSYSAPGDFNNQEQAYIKSAKEPGKSFKKVVRVVYTEGSESDEFIALKEGRRTRERKANANEQVDIEDIDESNKIGSPDEIDEIIGALEELQKKI